MLESMNAGFAKFPRHGHGSRIRSGMTKAMTIEDPQAHDDADPLAFARARFLLPDNVIYLDGNSLGAMPAAAPDALQRTAERQWGEDLIGSWNKHCWIDWPARIAAKLAPIVGVKSSELLIADSTSV